MIAPKPPINTLVDEFDYLPYVGMDDYGKSLFGETVTVKNVRVDRSAKYTFSGKEREVVYSAVVFCYAGLTQPFPDISLRSKVIFDGEEHVITNVIHNQEPYDKKLYSTEIEVI